MADVERWPLTGSPAPRPIWRVICEFANGSCICAAHGFPTPCASVTLAQAAVMERLAYEAVLRREEGRGR